MIQHLHLTLGQIPSIGMNDLRKTLWSIGRAGGHASKGHHGLLVGNATSRKLTGGSTFGGSQ